VAVNVSPAQMLHQDLVAEVRAVLEATGLPPDRLELEITEGVLVRDKRGDVATLERLKGLGVKLAIDDFGTGYSSLSYLKSFPVDKVKIDKSFVGSLEHDRDDRMIVDAVVNLGRALGLSTIAEGMETAGQAQMLRALGCDEAQNISTAGRSRGGVPALVGSTPPGRGPRPRGGPRPRPPLGSPAGSRVRLPRKLNLSGDATAGRRASRARASPACLPGPSFGPGTRGRPVPTAPSHLPRSGDALSLPWTLALLVAGAALAAFCRWHETRPRELGRVSCCPRPC
jgi:hypothetical protein